MASPALASKTANEEERASLFPCNFLVVFSHCRSKASSLRRLLLFPSVICLTCEATEGSGLYLWVNLQVSGDC